LKFAAIDIGSNAVRLLLTRVFENGSLPYFKKESLIRMPVRLGDEAFTRHRISDPKADMLLNTMIGFKYLMEAYRPLDYMACATSAMREVENGGDIVEKIKQRSGIDLQIIDGKIEAEMIYANHFEERLDKTKSYLYIDVGGGSTELTFFTGGKHHTSFSFNIGTVRLLENLVADENWQDMKHWIKRNVVNMENVLAIGSGGNINKIFKLARQKTGRPLSYKTLRDIYKSLNSFTYQERIRVLDLKPDRADVIIPASRIYTSVMKWGKINKIYVPEIGLADGIIHVLYEKYKRGEKKGIYRP
jgi:exopolyphosphatase/guanosine-5'-triphosphate,3'-diphosphate pyrophosphatase